MSGWWAAVGVGALLAVVAVRGFCAGGAAAGSGMRPAVAPTTRGELGPPGLGRAPVGPVGRRHLAEVAHRPGPPRS